MANYISLASLKQANLSNRYLFEEKKKIGLIVYPPT